MNNSMRESLSALFDGEASDLECRQVVRACRDGALLEDWSRMAMARAVLRNESSYLAPKGLEDGIFAALDRESAPRSSAIRGNSGVLKGLALAASVAAVAVVGYDLLSSSSSETQGPALASGAPNSDAERFYQPGQFRGVSNDAAYAQSTTAGSVFVSVPSTPDSSSTAAQSRLENYMFRHAEYASLNSNRGLMPFARVVSLQEE